MSKRERNKNVVDSKYDIHRMYFYVTSHFSLKRVLYKNELQQNWQELVDPVHGVNQQSMF